MCAPCWTPQGDWEGGGGGGLGSVPPVGQGRYCSRLLVAQVMAVDHVGRSKF